MNIRALQYKLSHKWQAVKDFFNPKNKWATKSIPNAFTDVEYIFEQILFNGLISFWENDDGEPTLRYQFEGMSEREKAEYPDVYNKSKEVYDALKLVYEYAKSRDPDNIEDQNTERTDTEALLTIIRYRKYMWS